MVRLVRHQTFLLILLFIVGAGIKWYHAPYVATFNAEVGQHYLEVIKLLQGQFLLQGPLTSHEWLRLSATPYYFFFPFFVLTKFHPLTLPFLWTVTSTLTLLLNYHIVSRIFDKSSALLSSLLYVLSPNILILDRNSGFFPFIIPLLYLLIYQSYRLFMRESTTIWTLFLLISLMFTLHASAILLLPFFVLFGILLHLFTKRGVISSIVAFLIPQLPLLLQDAFNTFTMTTHLTLWIPYKFLNFVTGKTYGVEKVAVGDSSLISIVDFFKLSILPPHFPWWTGLFVLLPLLIYFLILLIQKRFTFSFFLLALLFYGSLALYIHKNPPHHYFTPLMILPFICLSYLLVKIATMAWGRYIVPTIIGAIVVCLTSFIFSKEYLFTNDVILPFSTQKEIAQVIITDAKGQRFTLSRQGPFDFYDDEFKENYIYLLWWMGNKPLPTAPVRYLIQESPSLPSTGQVLTRIDGVTISKSSE